MKKNLFRRKPPSWTTMEGRSIHRVGITTLSEHKVHLHFYILHTWMAWISPMRLAETKINFVWSRLLKFAVQTYTPFHLDLIYKAQLLGHMSRCKCRKNIKDKNTHVQYTVSFRPENFLFRTPVNMILFLIEAIINSSYCEWTAYLTL